MAVLKITQWSYSRWKDYCECPRKAKYKHVDKIRTPDNPAQARGIAVHKAAEDFLKGNVRTLSRELKSFAPQFRELKKLGAIPEGELAFTRAWKRTGWFDHDVWVRVKLDAQLVLPTGDELCVYDWKTGRKYDDHEEQLSLYGLAALLINPLVKKARAEDWYVDQAPPDNVLEHTFYPRDLDKLKKQWEKNTKPMLNDTKFAPTPSRACGRCPFSKKNGGPCEF